MVTKNTGRMALLRFFLVAIGTFIGSQMAHGDVSPIKVSVLGQIAEVSLDISQAKYRAVYDSLLAWRAAEVRTANLAIKAELDSVYAAVLDSTGITLQPDRMGENYVRLVIPQTDRVLVGARGQWILDGAIPAEGDTIRARKDLAASGLARLAALWP